MLVDTHCHIHESSYALNAAEVLERARSAGVTRMVCVGTSEESSRQALEFASRNKDVYATIGVHPHDVSGGWQGVLGVTSWQLGGNKPLTTKLVAVGEIGLDYFYEHSPRGMQIEAFEAQIDLALRLNLPISFHVREAFSDFWPVLDNFSAIRGVLHSFTDSMRNMEEALKRGLYIGVNGISTFTKSTEQRDMFSAIPVQNLLIETDAPFLTPSPYRGKINEPALAVEVAAHHAKIRGVPLDELSSITTSNAVALFSL